MTVSTTCPFLIARETGYRIDELTPELLFGFSRSFQKYPPNFRPAESPDA